MKGKSKIVNELKLITGDKHVITSKWGKEPFSKGWRYGEGETLAVVKPGTLLEIWKILQKCVEYDVIVIMQAANTGLTGGSTPFGKGYDRSIIVVNTLRIKSIQIIDNGNQIIALPGSSLYDLENILKPLEKEPHSVIGSTSIGASIVGGVCNNSGGSLVHRGPAYTEFAFYAKVNKNGKLELVNELDINLGSSPEEILINLENNNYNSSDILKSKKLD